MSWLNPLNWFGTGRSVTDEKTINDDEIDKETNEDMKDKDPADGTTEKEPSATGLPEASLLHVYPSLCPHCVHVTPSRVEPDAVPRNEIIVTIQQYLDAVPRAVNRSHRIPIARELFDYLVQHSKFVHAHAGFERAVKMKLIQFALEDGVRFDTQYMALFGEELPHRV